MSEQQPFKKGDVVCHKSNKDIAMVVIGIHEEQIECRYKAKDGMDFVRNYVSFELQKYVDPNQSVPMPIGIG